MEHLEIAFSKKRLIFMISISALFVCLSLGVVSFMGGETTVLMAGVLALLLFGFALWFSVNKLIQNKPALVIDDLGIIENSSALSVGRIEWGQIKDLKVNSKSRSLVIQVKNPKYFIDREINWIKKTLMTMNWKIDQSPIHVNEILLAVSLEELVKEIKSRRWDGLPFNDLLEHLVDDY